MAEVATRGNLFDRVGLVLGERRRQLVVLPHHYLVDEERRCVDILEAEYFHILNR